MTRYRIVDLENSDIVAIGFAKDLDEFNNKFDRTIRNYDNDCESDWIPATQELINGKWVIIQ